jgi:hypothetical protein
MRVTVYLTYQVWQLTRPGHATVDKFSYSVPVRRYRPAWEMRPKQAGVSVETSAAAS